MTCEHDNPVRPDEVFTDDQCYKCWRTARRGLPVAAGVAKRGPCAHLGAKIDGPRQARCQCRYECEAGAAAFAVPGGVCQTCDQWEGE